MGRALCEAEQGFEGGGREDGGLVLTGPTPIPAQLSRPPAAQTAGRPCSLLGDPELELKVSLRLWLSEWPWPSPLRFLSLKFAQLHSKGGPLQPRVAIGEGPSLLCQVPTSGEAGG